MRFIPKQKIEILTPYDAERIHSILERNMYQDSGKMGAYPFRVATTRDGVLLDGTLNENGFVLKEYVNKKDPFYNKNTFEAQAVGTYYKGHNKTTIQVELGITPISKVFFTLWNVLICFVVLTSLVSLFMHFSSSTLGIAILSLLMMGGGYFMMLVSFRTSAEKLERRLRDILGRGKLAK